MKALFVHDHRFRRIGEVVYSPGGLPEAVLKRYQKAFGEVSVIGRIYDEYERKETYSPINDKQIRFVNFLHGGHNAVKNEVKKVILSYHDFQVFLGFMLFFLVGYIRFLVLLKW